MAPPLYPFTTDTPCSTSFEYTMLAPDCPTYFLKLLATLSRAETRDFGSGTEVTILVPDIVVVVSPEDTTNLSSSVRIAFASGLRLHFVPHGLPNVGTNALVWQVDAAKNVTNAAPDIFILFVSSPVALRY